MFKYKSFETYTTNELYNFAQVLRIMNKDKLPEVYYDILEELEDREI